MVDQESIYLAGFFDGEGNVMIARPHSNRPHQLRIQVGQVNPEPLRMLYERYGGTLFRRIRPEHEKAKPIWHWATTGRKAERALRDFLPWLVVKREETDVALAFMDGIHPQGRAGLPKRLSGDEVLRRETARLTLIALRQRDFSDVAVGAAQ